MPVTVVQDDDDCLAVWVAPGTPICRAIPADGLDLRARPVADRFTCDKHFAVVPWFGAGVLRVTYPGEAHSSWLFRRPEDHEQTWGWYGNLEDPLRRSDLGVHTVDHVLDVWLDLTTGTVGWKDEDELDAAIALGRFTPAEAGAIRAHGEQVFAAMQRRDAPYDGIWLRWAPDPVWPVPPLPDEYTSLAGKAAYELFPNDTLR